MRLPARFVAGNVVWTHQGTVWAVFRVHPVTYPWLPHGDKLQLHGHTRAILGALPGEFQVLSLCCPASGLRGATQRVILLAAELPAPARSGRRGPVAGSALASISSRFGLVAPRPSSGEIAWGLEQASTLLARSPAPPRLRPATAEEIAWAYASSLSRGLAARPPVPESPEVTLGPTEPVSLGPAQLMAAADAVLREGGHPSDPERPRHRRYLRVETEGGVAYQAFLVLSGMPHAFAFPGDAAEWLLAADSAGDPVDACLRVRRVPNVAAQASARRQARQLESQVAEYHGDAAGAPPGLADARGALDDLRAELAANPNEGELRVTTILAVGSPDLIELERAAGGLRTLYAARGYTLHRPIGGQLGLCTAMLPAAPTGRPARDYVHHLLGRDLAAAMPFAASGAGDPRGATLGTCLDAGTPRPVRLDPGYGPVTNHSGSLGVVGALGSGKSYCIKRLVHATLDAGGRVVVLDRSAGGEYARLAGAVPEGVSASLIDLSPGATTCLDPLQILSGDDRPTVALGFLTLVAGAAPHDLHGVALADAVARTSATPGGRLSDVIEALEAVAPADPHAADVWRGLRSAARHPVVRPAFSLGTPPALDADYLVFHTPGLTLPDREAELHGHLNRRLPPEQVLAQALLYLVAALMRRMIFDDTSRFAAALFDEAWCLTSSMQGRSLLLDGVRDGRKHNAAIWLLSQHPHDLGDPELADLLGPRLAFRQSAGAAPDALRFLGLKPTEEALRFLVAAPEGTCLLRDLDGRVGAVRILPAGADLHAVYDTNPGTVGRTHGATA